MNIVEKHYLLKKNDLICGVTNGFHDLKILKSMIKLGYKIIEVQLTSNKMDNHSRYIGKTIKLA